MKNKILLLSVKVALMVLFVAITALDSDSYIPHILALVSLAYLGLFNYANKERKWS